MEINAGTGNRIITKKNKTIFSLFLIIMLCTCCTNNEKSFFSEFQSTNGTWEISDVKKFTFDQQDTVTMYNVYLQLQANNDYPFSNIYLIAKTHFPNNQTYTDTLQYKMTDEAGKLLGEGFTDTKTSKLLYKEGYRFTEKGIYTIELEQAVRKVEEIDGVVELQGLTGVGLTIEKQ